MGQPLLLGFIPPEDGVSISMQKIANCLNLCGNLNCAGKMFVISKHTGIRISSLECIYNCTYVMCCHFICMNFVQQSVVIHSDYHSVQLESRCVAWLEK